MKNPYSLVFGVEPKECISRISQKSDVINGLLEETQRVYMITGVRGSGKTVFMSEVKSFFASLENWIVVEISTERNLLESLASKLSSRDTLAQLFQRAKINLSFFGFGVEIKGTSPIVDIEVVLQKMLETLKKHNQKLLVLVDEAIDNKEMREFASVFQMLLRDDLPINIVMTGLYENIDNLQNEKNLTFLHRAPKVHLSPLSMGTMADSYRRNLKVDENTSIKMAQLTKGYSYAFQVLGFLTWESGGNYKQNIVKLKQYLEEYVYDKIWSELSDRDKYILSVIAKVPSGKILDIRKLLDIKPNEFTPYKKRLIRKGIVSDEPGYARLALPLFDEFIRENYFESDTE